MGRLSFESRLPQYLKLQRSHQQGRATEMGGSVEAVPSKRGKWEGEDVEVERRERYLMTAMLTGAYVDARWTSSLAMLAED